MDAIYSSSNNIVLPTELFVKSAKEAKKIIRLESVEIGTDNIKKLNKKMYQRKVLGL